MSRTLLNVGSYNECGASTKHYLSTLKENGLNIECYTTDAVFETLKSDWNTLLSQSRSNRVFSTWEWQSTWWSAYHPGGLWVLAVRNDAQQLVGIAPWFIEGRMATGRTVRSVGCVDVTDYLEVIVNADVEAEVFEALVTYVTDHQAEFDTIDLCNIPEGSPILGYLPQLLEKNGFFVQIKPQEVCPVIPLPDTFEDYVNGLSKKNRHELRRKMRRADGLGDGIAWYVVGEEHDLTTELDKFIQLMATASPEKAEFLKDEQNIAFFKEMTPKMFGAGWLQLAFITINDEPAAAYMDFDYNNHILVYNSGLDLAIGGNYSAGIVLLVHLIRDAIERDHEKFDFLRGNEEYKYRMGGQDTQIYMLIATEQEQVEKSIC
jgi:CelD/BcsL family acetyltransferase involved in cellulose biosynthesis